MTGNYNLNLLVLKNKDIALDGTIKNQQKKRGAGKASRHSRY